VERDSSVGIVTRLEGGGEARFFAPVQTGPGAHTASYTMGTSSFPRVKRTGRGVDHPPTTSDEVKERVGLHLHSPSEPSWPVTGSTLNNTTTLPTKAHKYVEINFLYTMTCFMFRPTAWSSLGR